MSKDFSQIISFMLGLAIGVFTLTVIALCLSNYNSLI